MNPKSRKAMWAKQNQGSQSPDQQVDSDKQVDSKQQAMDDIKKKLQDQASDVIRVPEKDIKVVKLEKGSSALVSNSVNFSSSPSYISSTRIFNELFFTYLH
ncbi:MAG: hypothetical protein QQN43_04960 [Nitrosopumilus sp.]